MNDTDNLRRVHLWISGRVQGVFFRSSTQQQARARGLTGWVRNTPDGRVEAEIQGVPGAVERLIAECRSGPPAAHVTDVQIAEIDVVPDEQGFAVAY